MPYSGGVLDQPAGLVKQMKQLMNVYRAYREYEKHGKKAGEMAKWKKDNENLWATITEVNNLREELNNVSTNPDNN